MSLKETWEHFLLHFWTSHKVNSFIRPCSLPCGYHGPNGWGWDSQRLWSKIMSKNNKNTETETGVQAKDQKKIFNPKLMISGACPSNRKLIIWIKEEEIHSKMKNSISKQKSYCNTWKYADIVQVRNQSNTCLMISATAANVGLFGKTSRWAGRTHFIR